MHAYKSHELAQNWDAIKLHHIHTNSHIIYTYVTENMHAYTANQPSQNLDAMDLETAVKMTEKNAFTPNLAVTPSCG
jgi:hypothetical protein